MAAILNFPTKKWTKKMETVFFQSFRVNISEKSQLFKIYMKKSQNDTTPYTSCIVIVENYNFSLSEQSRKSVFAWIIHTCALAQKFKWKLCLILEHLRSKNSKQLLAKTQNIYGGITLCRFQLYNVIYSFPSFSADFLFTMFFAETISLSGTKGIFSSITCVVMPHFSEVFVTLVPVSRGVERWLHMFSCKKVIQCRIWIRSVFVGVTRSGCSHGQIQLLLVSYWWLVGCVAVERLECCGQLHDMHPS